MTRILLSNYLPFKQQIRTKSAFTKLSEWYQDFWNPQPSPPPYSHICQVGDPVLRRKSEPVKLDAINSDEIRKILLRMRAVMRHYNAVGLAAPQIGVPLRIFMIELTASEMDKIPKDVVKTQEIAPVPFSVFINPDMQVTNNKKSSFRESCESIRGLSALVPRFQEVLVKGYDWEGAPVEFRATGWTARIIQHEMDHLEGRMYTDLMDRQSLEIKGWKMINARCGRVTLCYH